MIEDVDVAEAAVAILCPSIREAVVVVDTEIEAGAVVTAEVFEEVEAEAEVVEHLGLPKSTGKSKHLDRFPLRASLTDIRRIVGGQAPAYDKQIEAVENKAATLSKQKKASLQMPHRPGYGTVGRPVLLWANYFDLAVQKDVQLYRYHIEIKPADNKGKTPTGKRAKRVIQLLMQQHFDMNQIVSDYSANLISHRQLTLEEAYTVTYMAENEDEPDEKAPTYQCGVQPTGSLSLAELVDHVTSTQAGLMFGSKAEIIQALNIVLGHHAKSQIAVATVAASRHFDTTTAGEDRRSLGGGLQVIRGFFMSVRAATARLLVNVQVKNMAFYEEGPLAQIMANFIKANGSNKVMLLRFVKKLSINVTHIKRQNKRGQSIPRIKTIMGFATKDDGHKLHHPPQVSQYGAGAKDVQFWLNSSPTPGSSSQPGAKGKKAVKAGPTSPSGGKYISVYDFFKQRKLTMHKAL